ncbi:MAG: ribosome biogenesis GTPase YlqF [Eubacteriales bacterium]|nr:ribosome biogenesis GTPase YlqF [Eubacteriales bacterium]
MNINWYPGHMSKTKKILEDNLKLVDLVIELADARIPMSSRNPVFESILKTKPRVLVLNKSDIADEKLSMRWQNWFITNGVDCILANSMTGTGIMPLKNRLKEYVSEEFERKKLKGLKSIKIKTMVAGIPNSGKSSFINRISGRNSAKTGDRPGITIGKQWIRLDEGIDLLDTPGILWPKFENEEIALNLAFTGAIKDDVFDKIEVAAKLAERLLSLCPEKMKDRYGDFGNDAKDRYELLQIIGKRRGFLSKGGEVDLLRTSIILLDEFRSGRIGRITLEVPPR